MRRLGVGRGEWFGAMIKRLQGAVETHEGGRADAEVDVGSARIKAEAQECGDVHAVGEVAVILNMDDFDVGLAGAGSVVAGAGAGVDPAGAWAAGLST